MTSNSEGEFKEGSTFQTRKNQAVRSPSFRRFCFFLKFCTFEAKFRVAGQLRAFIHQRFITDSGGIRFAWLPEAEFREAKALLF
jgi:hypothetical protein